MCEPLLCTTPYQGAMVMFLWGAVFGPLKYSGSSPDLRLVFYYASTRSPSCQLCHMLILWAHLVLPPIFSLLLTWPLVFCGVCLSPIPVTSVGMWMEEVSIPCPSLTRPKFPGQSAIAERTFQVHGGIVLVSGQLVLVSEERPWTS